MRPAILILLSIVLFQCSTSEKDNTAAQIAQIKKDVYLLASDSLQGREVGTEGEKMAASYLAERLKALGIAPAGTEGYYQDFFVKESNNPHEKPMMSAEDSLSGTSGRNVIGLIDNPGDEIIVIGAHFDHLGFGGFSSLHRGDSAVHNGADDNASGTAALLHIASQLKAHPIQRDVLIIAFSGEEKGLWGSNYFAKNPTVDLSKVDYMINMDMVGKLDSARGLAIYGTGTAPQWSSVIDTTNTYGLKILKKESGVGPSDHTSFYLQDLPVLHFFTGQHEDYHKPGDDAEKLNYEGIHTVSSHILDIIRWLEKEPKLTFQKTKDESEKGPRFTVTLGVVPDYLYDGKGMRIDGVSDDKPAQKAGLVKGDIVIQMGDSTITDMMSYMKALSAFQKGDSTKVVIKRGEAELEMDVAF